MKPETPVPENGPSARLATAGEIAVSRWRSVDEPALAILVEEARGANDDFQGGFPRCPEGLDAERSLFTTGLDLVET